MYAATFCILRINVLKYINANGSFLQNKPAKSGSSFLPDSLQVQMLKVYEVIINMKVDT